MSRFRTEDERYAFARRLLPGGVSGIGRLNTALGRSTQFERAAGSRLWDMQGRQYVDLHTGFGAVLVGHGHPLVSAAVQEVLGRGMLAGYETDLLLDVAERLCRTIPSYEMVRFGMSGTEATMYALRTARTFTGRPLVVKFEGHFHGYNDSLSVSAYPPLADAGPADTPTPFVHTQGLPPGAESGTLVAPFNDEAALTALMERAGDRVAAVILEPVNYNNGCIKPRPGFLQFLRRICDRYGAVLIFDEVLSGFRTAPGGIQEEMGVTPDMTTLSKCMAGGLPLSAFGGRREVMGCVSPTGPAVHTATFAAHPVSMAGCKAFLEIIHEPGFYERLRALEQFFYPRLQAVFDQHELPVCVQWHGPRFGLYFGVDREVWNYRDQAVQDDDLAKAFYRAVLEHGVYMNATHHHGFSSAHTEADLQEALDGIARACDEVAGRFGKAEVQPV